jgi:hypothetical protein
MDYKEIQDNNMAIYFFNSNSLVIKAAVILTIVVFFIIFFRLGVFIMSHALAADRTPFVMPGLKKATSSMVIRQDPRYEDSVTLFRSVDENDGLEFTWSVWLYIDDIEHLSNQHRHIFHKGNLNIINDPTNMEKHGINFPNNGPGMYIKPNSNDLLITMNSFSVIREDVVVKDIPLKKWVNVMIRVEDRNVDAYVNGMIVSRRQMKHVPKQNYGDIYINYNGGFSGFISDLRYFNYAVNIPDINSIIRRGPSLKTNKASIDKSFPPYLSTNWYLNTN